MLFSSDSPAPLSRRSEVVFWCFAVFMLLLHLGHNALWGLEGRSSEVIREMLLTGDYFNPQINGVLDAARLPLSYWVMLPAAMLLGLDEFTMRLPAVIAALITLWATRQIACKLFDEYTALLAMWLLLSTYGFVFWARMAAPDMANAAAVSCAVVSFLYWKDVPDFKDYFSFYLLLAVGSLFKGIPMVAVVLVLVFPLFISRKQWKNHLNFRHLLAIFCAVCLGLFPYWFFGTSGHHSACGGMHLLWDNQIVRILGAKSSGEPFYSYIYELPRILLPWSAVFAVSFFVFIKRRKELTADFVSLLYGMILAFILFSFSGSRAWYYLLPLVPFCAVVMAAALNGFAGSSPAGRAVIGFMRAVLLITGSLALALPIALPLQGMIFSSRLPGVMIAAICFAGFVVVVLMTFDQPEENVISRMLGLAPRTASLVCGMAIAVTVIFCVVIPGFTYFRTEKPFLLELRQKSEGISSGNFFYFGNNANSRMLFYLAPEQNIQCGNDMASFIRKKSGRRVVIVSEGSQEELETLSGMIKKINGENTLVLEEKRLSFEPVNKDKFRAWIFEVPGKVNAQKSQQIGELKNE